MVIMMMTRRRGWLLLDVVMVVVMIIMMIIRQRTYMIYIMIIESKAWLVTARCAGDCRATSLRLRLASGQVDQDD